MTMTDPVSPDLKRHLRTLKLGQLMATLPERLALARQQNLPHADFLELLLSDEVTRRENGSAARRARAAGLDPQMRPYDPAGQPAIYAPVIGNLAHDVEPMSRRPFVRVLLPRPAVVLYLDPGVIGFMHLDPHREFSITFAGVTMQHGVSREFRDAQHHVIGHRGTLHELGRKRASLTHLVKPPGERLTADVLLVGIIAHYWWVECHVKGALNGRQIPLRVGWHWLTQHVRCPGTLDTTAGRARPNLASRCRSPARAAIGRTSTLGPGTPCTPPHWSHIAAA